MHYNKLPFRKGIERVSSPKIDQLVIFFRKCYIVMSIIGDHDIAPVAPWVDAVVTLRDLMITDEY